MLPDAYMYAPIIVSKPLTRYSIAWIRCGQLAGLRLLRSAIERLNAPLPVDKTRLDYLLECDYNGKNFFPFSPPLIYSLAMASSFSSQYGVYLSGQEMQALMATAIAVERYRRQHAALPESLDALIPEFLDAVPVSAYDNAPLTYEHGLIEVAAPTNTPAAYRERLPSYTFNGFRVSGSFYANRHGDKKWRQHYLPVPLDAGKSDKE